MDVVFELHIAAPLCERKSLLAAIQTWFGHDAQGSTSTSFIFSRGLDIRKHVLRPGNMFALLTEAQLDLPFQDATVVGLRLNRLGAH